ncbi:hypothetical protein ACFWP7_03255 [Streptomyces sp. NPDC058470]|uniref:hypothetical protein n=1 Tax=Streptomyces sp. NPDC058470 TaxID=3346515 RepID=UPI00364DD7A2
MQGGAAVHAAAAAVEAQSSEQKSWSSQREFTEAEFIATAQQEPNTTDVTAAVETVREVLTAAGIVLPSPGADVESPPLNLITLGRSCVDVVLRLVDVIQRGCV